MATSAIENVGASAAGAKRGLTNLKSEDFFRLLIAELRQQDPLQPSKTEDMIGQVSQIRSIELSGQLTDALSAITQQQRTSGASDLLGKYVTAHVAGDDGQPVQQSGIVTGVRFDADGSAILELDSGFAIRAADVTLVTTSDQAARQSAGGATTATGAPQQNPPQPQASAGAAAEPAADKSAAASKPRWMKWLGL